MKNKTIKHYFQRLSLAKDNEHWEICRTIKGPKQSNQPLRDNLRNWICSEHKVRAFSPDEVAKHIKSINPRASSASAEEIIIINLGQLIYH